MYNIKNITDNRGVVCSLKDGSSFRLLPKSEATIKDNLITDYLINLSKGDKPILVVRHTEDNNNTIKNVKKGDKEVK